MNYGGTISDFCEEGYAVAYYIFDKTGGIVKITWQIFFFDKE